jgi:hypothetical protein
MSFQIAYISQGKLYLWAPDGTVRDVESEFGRDMQVRTQQMQKQKAWKNRSTMELMMPAGMAKQLQRQAEEALLDVNITSVCPAGEGSVYYSLESDGMGGVFTFDTARDRENRLFHSADFKVSYLDLDPKQAQMACTMNYPNGSANIATFALDAVRPRDITEGDSIDLAPRWVPGSGRALVFQSAGIARNADGYVRGRSAFCIEKLDFQAQDVLTLANDPKSDLLGPQMDAQGLLYYIRRPYRVRTHIGFWQMVKQVLLIPVRLAQAIYGFMDYFAKIYAGKPLMGASPGQPEIEPKFLKAWGEWVTPEMLMKGNRQVDDETAALVPDTWQLVRQGTHGVPEVLASHVLSYDLAEDGSIIYTNGSAIFKISPKGEQERLHTGKFIEHLVLI